MGMPGNIKGSNYLHPVFIYFIPLRKISSFLLIPKSSDEPIFRLGFLCAVADNEMF
jgi:hypothetical protein